MLKLNAFLKEINVDFLSQEIESWVDIKQFHTN